MSVSLLPGHRTAHPSCRVTRCGQAALEAEAWHRDHSASGLPRSAVASGSPSGNADGRLSTWRLSSIIIRLKKSLEASTRLRDDTALSPVSFRLG
ncbi:hypothetical protein JW921_00205 [Candidatus Fermentibacterales bacterium]|nr:hypothetical protein [Candidatus Fermentibacterales bacterium]